MTRRDDPKRLKAQQEREKARVRLNVVLQGVGHAFCDEARERFSSDSVVEIITIVNTDLIRAVNRMDAAEKAYEPFWGRRRRRVSVLKRPPKKVKAAA
jgi:hypothetical protein